LQSRKSVSLIATLLLLLLLSTLVTRAHAFTNGQSASLVIGQKDFTSGSFAGASQSRLTGPDYVIFDSSGNLWVGDTTNNRVLEFRTPFSTGMNASLVIGQPDFVTSTPVTSQSGLNFVSQAERVAGFAFDSTGNLWVADLGNNRVLEFKSPFSMGMPASLVIGQKDFTTAGLATTKDGLVKPSAVAFDHSNNLWVVDGRNFRVLEFNPPFNNGMSASLVIGQADFETNKPSASQTGLTTTFDIAVDPSGNLWVGDKSRVLEFRAPFSNGMNASVVIGQASFATSKASAGRTGLSGPQAITTDSAGNLWVGDTDNMPACWSLCPHSAMAWALRWFSASRTSTQAYQQLRRVGFREGYLVIQVLTHRATYGFLTGVTTGFSSSARQSFQSSRRHRSQSSRWHRWQLSHWLLDSSPLDARSYERCDLTTGCPVPIAHPDSYSQELIA
jgi:sugar lactone lactonase YvrE